MKDLIVKVELRRSVVISEPVTLEYELSFIAEYRLPNMEHELSDEEAQEMLRKGKGELISTYVHYPELGKSIEHKILQSLENQFIPLGKAKISKNSGNPD